jgi:hypothetical protein
MVPYACAIVPERVQKQHAADHPDRAVGVRRGLPPDVGMTNPLTERSPLVVCVNISGSQFRYLGLVQDVVRVFRESRLGPGTLKLKITESVFVEPAPTASRSTD